MDLTKKISKCISLETNLYLIQTTKSIDDHKKRKLLETRVSERLKVALKETRLTLGACVEFNKVKALIFSPFLGRLINHNA